MDHHENVAKFVAKMVADAKKHFRTCLVVQGCKLYKIVNITSNGCKNKKMFEI